MPEKNLYEEWLKKHEKAIYEREHGVTMGSRVGVKSFTTPEGWEVRITGPWPLPTPEDFETEEDLEVAINEFQPFHIFMSYYIVEGRLWGSKRIETENYEDAVKEAEKYSKNHSTWQEVYDPEKTRIDGEWVPRENLLEKLEAWAAKQKEKFERDKVIFLKKKGQ